MLDFRIQNGDCAGKTNREPPNWNGVQEGHRPARYSPTLNRLAGSTLNTRSTTARSCGTIFKVSGVRGRYVFGEASRSRGRRTFDPMSDGPYRIACPRTIPARRIAPGPDA